MLNSTHDRQIRSSLVCPFDLLCSIMDSETAHKWFQGERCVRKQNRERMKKVDEIEFSTF